MHQNILTYLLIYLAAMVALVPLAKKLGLGVVLGYLLAGVLIGPSVLGLTAQNDSVALLAELGVVLMLFTIGLELDAKKLWAMRQQVFVAGSVQLLGCALALGLLVWVLGLSWQLALLLGLTLSLSSTAVAMQLMKDQNLAGTATGRTVFAALLLQDMAAIPLLIGISLLAPGSGAAPFVWWAALLAIAGLCLVGRYGIGYLLHWVAHHGSRELFVALALLFVIAVTELMTLVGLSAGLGAFIAGVLLASSEFRHQLEADLEPFKGLFLGLFFITIGAGIELPFLASHWSQVLCLVLAFMLLKMLALYGIARALGIAAAERWHYALLLGQGSEFAFVLAALALAGQLLSVEQAALLNLVIALSMAVSPLLLNAYLRWCQRPAAQQQHDETATFNHSPVIIAGFGRYGQIVGRMLASHGLKPTVLDHDSDTIQAMRRFGFEVYYGDARRLDLLEAAGAAHAKVLVVALDDADSINEVVSLCRRHFPQLQLMVRARDVAHLYQLRKLGVQHIQRELFESSLMQGRQVLTALGLGAYEAREVADRFRAANLDLIDKMEQVREQQDEKTYLQLLRQSREELQRQLERETQLAPQKFQAPD